MSGWEVGDLAVCVDVSPRRTPSGRLRGTSRLELGKTYTVRAVGVDRADVTGLWLEGFPGSRPGDGFAACRFRKVKPDVREACEEEFVTLLQRIKQPGKVSA